MHTISRLINSFANRQVKFCNWMLVGLGIAMSVIILLQVFFRYVVGASISWSEEAARYLMVWMGSLGAVVALRQGRHIGVRVLVDRLPGRTYDRFLVPVVQATIVTFLSFLLWQGVELANFNLDQLSPALEIPMLIPYAAVPAAALMMILDILADILQDRWPTDMGSQANIAASVLNPDALGDECKAGEEDK
ncbi:MAG: TRAP transporter small permease [Desulfarculaceae bacterium]|jgi:TRAP-type C4-dicarboxylate transport system permease small subunit